MNSLLRVAQRSYTKCHSKIYKSAREALYDVKDGDSISMGGFGIVGIPENGVFALIDMGVKDINIISNLAGIAEYGIGLMLQKGQVKRMNGSYVGENPVFERQYLNGEIELNLIPQGTLAERCRAGTNGIGAMYVKAGVGTLVETGGFPVRLGEGGKSIVKVSKPKEKRTFDGKEYLLEEAIRCDYAMIRGYKADCKGNVRFRKTARNFNPDMAGMARVNVLEVEEIVDELRPEEIHLPGCFFDRIYKGEHFPKKIERLKFDLGDQKSMGNMSGKDEKRIKIAKRAMKELKPGFYCNLGIGIPTLIANFVIGKIDMDLQSENGIVGVGPYPKKHQVDSDMINAGKETITAKLGYAIGRSSETFGQMRGLHLHMTMLGGMEVSETGDLANWIVPGQKVKGMGGAMDLVSCGSKVVVTMEHTSKGASKVLPKCSLPLTGKGVVSKLVTEMAVFEFVDNKMILSEIAPDVTLEQVKASTLAHYTVSPSLKKIEYD